MKRKNIILCFLLLILIAFFFLNKPDGKYKNFEQIGFKETINTLGNPIRVYSVFIKDFVDSPEMWSKIEMYSKIQMYTPGGMTTVLFFNNRAGTPDVTWIGVEFDPKYEKYCIAAFWKYPNGAEKFSKVPFK